MIRKIRRLTLRVIIAAMVLGTFALPGQAGGIKNIYAAANPAPNLSIASTGAQSASIGEENVRIAFSVENNGTADFDYTGVELKFSNKQGISDVSGTTGGSKISASGSMSLEFIVNIGDNATEGRRDMQIIFTTASGTVEAPQYYPLQIEDRLSGFPASSSNYAHAADFIHKITPEAGFAAGSGNSVTFEVHNRGNTYIRNAELSIVLPDGMSVYNDSTAANVGYISVGERKSKTFPILVDDDLDGDKTYPITIRVRGTDMANAAVSLEKTFYIPVTGDGAGSMKNISIQNISIPYEVQADEDFSMAFSVNNSGTGAVKNVKVYAEMPEGILNRTNATFVIDSINAGETNSYSVTMFAKESSGSSYPIKIAAEALNSETTESVTQYASVFVRGGGDDAKTPQLMVDQYSYGGDSVTAGRDFFLNLGLFNTSNKTLSNIKITLASDDGTFVPVDSSNSFFVDRVESGGRFTKSVMLSAKPSAEQKTTAIVVKMSYEDDDGEAYTAEDTISIPVTQVMRLSVDNIVPPYECYVGMPTSSTVQFYNMGKTTLDNLKVNCEGNFDVTESNSYFVGNMEGGKSDSYTFVLIPREIGPLEGKVIFTYEDANGNPMSYEAPFVFEVMEMPEWEDPMMEMPEEKKTPWMLIIFGAALLVVIAGIMIGLKIRKARLHKKLEIQDAEFYAALDSDKEMKANEQNESEDKGTKNEQL